jgi:phosphomannomutase
MKEIPKSIPDLLKLAKKKNKLSQEAYQNILKWLSEEEFLPYKEEINSLIREGNWVELEDSFYTHIRIGTGGIRGKIGAGPNRINLRTIGEAAQGLSQFIEDFGEEAKKRGVVISKEVRKHSEEFAILCCEVLAANGIRSYFFDGIRSTPELSFTIRHLKAIAGVEITASHNPRTDNGFKFFWTDGGQVVPPLDLKFMGLVLEVKDIKKMPFEEAKQKGLIQIIGKGVDEAYFQKICELSLVKTRSAKIVFSPIHSSGGTNALPILKNEGFKVSIVPEQIEPNENFPTAFGDYINPEFEQVMEFPIKLGEKIGADIAICTDPDACRIGAAFKTNLSSKKLTYLTANEIGSAILYFILSLLKKSGKLRKSNLFIKTYLTTSLTVDICKSFGIKYVDDLLVGYKWIGQVVEHLKDTSDFLFSFEDTCGYCRGDFIRDKDGAIAAFTVAEMISWLKDQNKTLTEYLNEIYQRYGYYRNVLYQVEVVGREGFEDIVKLYKAFRADPPKKLAGRKVLKIIDRLDPKLRDPQNYIAGVTGDELTFVLSSDERIRFSTRPSGTQPQFKYYLQTFGTVNNNLPSVKKQVDTLAEEIEKDIYAYQDRILDKKLRGIKIKSRWN